MRRCGRLQARVTALPDCCLCIRGCCDQILTGVLQNCTSVVHKLLNHQLRMAIAPVENLYPQHRQAYRVKYSARKSNECGNVILPRARNAASSGRLSASS